MQGGGEYVCGIGGRAGGEPQVCLNVCCRREGAASAAAAAVVAAAVAAAAAATATAAATALEPLPLPLAHLS